jgi:hypothetical protein
MLNRITYRRAERKQNHHPHDPRSRPKHNVSNRPSVLERPHDEDELGDNVDSDADDRPEEVGDEQGDRLGVREGGEILERRDGNEEYYAKDEQA